MKNTSSIDRAIDILEENSEYFDKHRQRNTTSKVYDDEKDQPGHFSWLHTDVEGHNIATDTSNHITYDDLEDMREQFLEYVSAMASPKLLQMILRGQILHLTFRIGPRGLSGTNLNDEYGIEVDYGK